MRLLQARGEEAHTRKPWLAHKLLARLQWIGRVRSWVGSMKCYQACG
jgi:hypothetical protein